MNPKTEPPQQSGPLARASSRGQIALEGDSPFDPVDAGF